MQSEAKPTNINIWLHPEIKQEAENIFANHGLTIQKRLSLLSIMYVMPEIFQSSYKKRDGKIRLVWKHSKKVNELKQILKTTKYSKMQLLLLPIVWRAMMTNERKRKIIRTSQFKKDLRQANKQGKDMAILEQIVDFLADDIPLPDNSAIMH